MKTLITLLTLLNAFSLFAKLDNEFEVNFAEITKIESNGFFPTQKVTITFNLACHEEFKEVVQDKLDNKVHLGVRVESHPQRLCLMHLPLVRSQQVEISVFSMTPIEFVSYSDPDLFGGSSVENFN